MPLKSYGVLVGQAVDRRVETDLDTPHYQIRMESAGSSYRIAVNVRSSQSPPDLLYQVIEHLEHPMLAPLMEFADGFHILPSAPGGVALDYIRQNLVDRDAMRTLPSSVPGPDNDLSDRIDHFVERAIADPDARIYAFGERWGPEKGVADKVFGFLPGNGVHDIHMNQGNDGPYVRDDGVWQDGGLLIHFPGEDQPGEGQWVGLFLAFQSQAWHTDDVTGHRIEELPGGAGDGWVRIVGARQSGGSGAGARSGDPPQQDRRRHLAGRLVAGRPTQEQITAPCRQSGSRRSGAGRTEAAGGTRQQGWFDHAARSGRTQGARCLLYPSRRSGGMDRRLLSRSPAR